MSDALQVPLDETPDTTTSAVVGRMIVTLTLNASNKPIPSVEFDPPGLFTPGILNHNTMLFIQRLQQEQAKVRHATVRATTIATADVVGSV